MRIESETLRSIFGFVGDSVQPDNNEEDINKWREIVTAYIVRNNLHRISPKELQKYFSTPKGLMTAVCKSLYENPTVQLRHYTITLS